MKKLMMLGIVLTLAILLAACGDDSAEETEGAENPDQEAGVESGEQQVGVTDEEKVDEDTAVVSVDGTEINGDRYNPIYTQVKMQMAEYGEDVSDNDLLKEQTINVLVEQQLIRQDAENNGLNVTEEEVESEFETLKEENGEQLTAVLEQFELTEESFKRQLADDLITNKYIESELEIEVSDEEAEEYYEQVREQQGEEVGEYEEVEELIKDQIADQKVQEVLQAKVEELKEQAEVETLI
ncbi:SurA N-terminal domain-containing protein [Virgibacillus sp. C22-A2]|uniref:SurA N-terminal domain-containing protein n=1 Tax=Virgibacillus tibetensis TaxID=3042313 RepID=A0ABU6KH33_9BACI|nr:SurA N-terminal domain-containing protein [Virgibacillus sp. C22-A2]